jgi:hypothetical protein
MTTNNKKNKKNSAARKLIPAIGMLTVSAMMLSSSTYAWFTMSREVEVKNIQMTASVPEDLQISLGKLTNIKTGAAGNPTAAEISVNANGYVGLSGNQGILFGSADDGGATAPDNDGTAVDNLFWANTADISEYYRLGKIIPASSIDGKGIFFTPDASGQGKTLKDGAKFYQVADLTASNFSTIYKWDSTNSVYSTSGGGDEARTKLHAITKVNASEDTWNPANPEGDGNGYDSADAWNTTNDDGYYVDIPVWFRNSAKEDATLAVDAYVTTNAGRTQDADAASDDELYLAARAAIIYDKTSGGTTAPDSTGLLRIRKDSFTSTDSIINYMYSTNNSGDAVASVASYKPTYGDADEYDGTAFLTVPGRDETDAAQPKYGEMVKAVVRVWLEGEDPNCWNPNAGQDFNISLKFTKEAIANYPAEYNKGNADQAANLSVDASTVVTIKETINGVANSELKFQFNGLTGDQAKWDMTQGSPEILDGKTYTISGNDKTGTVTGAAGIAAWLKTNVTKKSDVEGKTYTITAT